MAEGACEWERASGSVPEGACEWEWMCRYASRSVCRGFQYVAASMDERSLSESRTKAEALGVAVPDNSTYMDWRVSFNYVRAARTAAIILLTTTRSFSA